jgi:uncharacterized membrane protein
MDTLSVWRFDGPHGADAALPQLERLARAGRLDADDAALVSWPPGARKPSTHALGTFSGPGRLWGGFWGVVLALVFLTPLAGPVFGAAAGAVAGSLSDFGVPDDFVQRVRKTVGPGSSAIFVMSSGATADRIAAELGDLATGKLRHSLSAEQEQHLRDALGEESASQP